MKYTTIDIMGIPFTYKDEIDDITYETISPISEQDATDLLNTTKKLFDYCGIQFSLAFGTLLGAIRENGIIKGDEDVDVFIEDESNLRKNLPYLEAHGLGLCRVCEHKFYSFHTLNDSYIDVYIKSKLPLSIWSIWCDSLNGRGVPRRYIRRFDTITFLGVECLVPHKPERILKFWYGKDWRIPINGHVYTYEVPSRYWWLTKGKNYIKKAFRVFRIY